MGSKLEITRRNRKTKSPQKIKFLLWLTACLSPSVRRNRWVGCSKRTRRKGKIPKNLSSLFRISIRILSNFCFTVCPSPTTVRQNQWVGCFSNKPVQALTSTGNSLPIIMLYQQFPCHKYTYTQIHKYTNTQNFSDKLAPALTATGNSPAIMLFSTISMRPFFLGTNSQQLSEIEERENVAFSALVT